ncbi:LuxR C-terminal-related transcriptional regulator [Pedobacter heparinus]|uniref:LuxR C-terminal-related transcriptional regulator n=1 Tax=Pedobacter heparinus TaxID=984 RepID=UPI00292EBF18|nr:LuxR C-terminal-related transcriptional regulator [Pedobacter heparinus]
MDDPSLQDEIRNAVAGIAAVANELPGVVIVHDLVGTVIWMSPRGLKELGVKLEDVIGLTAEQYYAEYFNSEDAKDYVPKLLGLLERNNNEEYLTYFQQVRLSGQEDWNWHMSSTKIFLRNEKGQPILTITMSFPIDAMHHMAAKAARLLEENNFLHRNLNLFGKLSKREREVLSLMALGKTSSETAEELFIAQNTVETHRKNIKQKLNTSSYYEICQYARAFDLI